MLAATIENALNRGLPRSPRARQICAELAGHRVAVEVRGIVDLLVDSDGNGLKVTSGSAEAAEARVSGGPIALLALAGPDAAAAIRRGDIQIGGNAEIAQKFRELMLLLRPDPEEELALAIGDVPGHEIARFARATLGWCRRTAETTLRNFAEYFAHERGDLVSGSEGRQLLTGIDAVRDDIDRLEARIEDLARRIEAGRQETREA